MTEPASTNPSPTRNSVGRNLIEGSIWMVAMRLGIRGIGLINTMILARVLVPADFGIVAMAMLVISFIEVFSETGQQSALIRHAAPDRAHYDSAWTMSVMINTGLTVLILAVAPFAPLYFPDPRIVPVIQLLSLRVFLGGFFNIGVIDFRRHLNFAREFKFGLLRKLLTFFATLALALTWRNYWALAVGTVIGTALEISLSYLMHPYRPRLHLSKVRELWGYSIWLLVAGLGRYFQGRIDEVVVAGVVLPASMGRYTVSAEIGGLPGSEILEPVARALFPNFAKLAADPVQLSKAYLYSLSATVTISAALATGIALVAPDLVAIMLGPQWTEAAALIPWFAVGAGVSGIGNTVFTVLNAAGESRLSAIQSWVRVGCYIPAMLWAAGTHHLVNFAIAKLVVAILLLPTFFGRLRQVIPVNWSALAEAMWRPPVAAVGMICVILPLSRILPPQLNAFVDLPIKAIIGAVVFIGVQVALWVVSGRPPGLEERLWLWAKSQLRTAV